MTQQLLIQVPQELRQKLINDANRFNLSLENWVLNLLNRTYDSLNVVDEDPILPLLGSLKAEVNDIGENHDIYLNQILSEEIKIVKK